MAYVIAHYWPFVALAIGVGFVFGWWLQSPRSVDRVTAWLERGGHGS